MDPTGVRSSGPSRRPFRLSPSAVSNLKREAKKISRVEGIPHVQALNRIALREGFPTWWHLQRLHGER